MDPRSRIRPAGLTLTEVLIVIVIIAVLAGLIFPLFRGMREKGQAAVCAQNLRQIGIGLLAHISENNGRFPNGRAHVSWLKDDDNNSLGLSWYDAAAKNLGRENYSNKFNDPGADPLPDVFGCPSGHGKAYHPAWPYTGDYAGNLYLGQVNHKVLTMSAVKNPASTPYVQDTVKQNNFGVGIYRAGSSNTADFAFAARHGGKGNILWVDGHVTSWTYSEYMKFANDPQRGGAYNFVRGNW
jgi:prepilin-type processing-associated H-X9-DG protein/prepilin-type N-terminal cleavage/methylation domain-containing protein